MKIIVSEDVIEISKHSVNTVVSPTLTGHDNMVRNNIFDGVNTSLVVLVPKHLKTTKTLNIHYFQNLETLGTTLRHLSLKRNKITAIGEGLICLEQLISLDLGENEIS